MEGHPSQGETKLRAGRLDALSSQKLTFEEKNCETIFILVYICPVMDANRNEPNLLLLPGGKLIQNMHNLMVSLGRK